LNVSKIILTRCQIFRLKCIKFNFGWGYAPDPRWWSSQRSPDPSLKGKGQEKGKYREGGEGGGAREGIEGGEDVGGKGREGEVRGGGFAPLN